MGFVLLLLLLVTAVQIYGELSATGTGIKRLRKDLRKVKKWWRDFTADDDD